MRGDIGAFEAAASKFEVENVRGYPGEGLMWNELLVLVINGV